MKIGMKKLIALLLAAAMLLAMAACAPANTGADTGDGDGAAADADRDAVVASIGGKYEITKGELMDQYDYLVSMYESYGMAAPSTEADIETMQDSVLDSLVAGKVLLYKAEEMGLTLDEEGKAALEGDLDEEMQYWIDQFTTQAESEGATDVETRMKELFNEALSQSGMGMDMDGYKEYMRGILEDTALTTKLEETVKQEISVTEEEVQDYYDNLLETQKADYEQTPANYQTDSEGYDMSGGNPVVYAPKGYMRVKTVTVSPEAEIDEAYATLSEELDKLEAEFGKLSLSDASANAKRIAEIRKEYAEKKTEADAMYESYIKDAREKIQKAYAALEAGTSFDEVLAEYGEDDMFKTYPAIKEKGILMLKEGEAKMDAKLVEAVKALEAGAYSDIIQLDDMFYIVSPVGDEPDGVKTLEDVRDAVESMALSEKAESAWTAQQEEWNNDTSLVTYFEDVYRSVGKDAIAG